MIHRPKILIVDDKVENLITLENLLDEFDAELVRAISGEEALAQILDHDFALVLLDVQMPDMDGYEVAELMRGNRKTKSVPIIFVTARSKTEAHIFKGYESGAVDYLFKPLIPEIFNSKVGVFIELYNNSEALRQKTYEFDQKLAELEELQQQLEETNAQLLMLSTTDGLTGLLNKRRFDQLLRDEWERAARSNTPLGLIYLDIDHFKQYNDSFGHHIGDDCLRRVARCLSNMGIRELDAVARIGGEEFSIILPGTDDKGATLVAEKIRKAIEDLAIEHNTGGAQGIVTASLGVCSVYPNKEMAPHTLIQAADDALYLSKKNGRNCVSFKSVELISSN